MVDFALCRKPRNGLVVLAVVLSSGCGREAAPGGLPGVRVDVEVRPEPPEVGPATVGVTLTGDDGEPLRDATVRVEGNMNHAGMKPEFGDGREVEPGRYEAPLEFTMGGDWFLLVDVRLADGRTLRKQVDVPAVRTR